MRRCGFGDPTKTELPTSETSSRIKFANVETSRYGSAPVAPGCGSRVTFVGRLPEESPLQMSRSQLDGLSPTRPRAEKVPELSYDLSSGGSVTATICGHVCS